MPSDGYSAREEIIADDDGTMFVIEDDGAVLTDLELTGYRATSNGRCISVQGAKNCVISNILFHPGDDDALGIINDCRGTVIVGCSSDVADYSRDTKPLLCGGSPSTTQVAISAKEGYAASFYNCDLDGDAITSRITGGVYNFVNCTLRVSRLCGIDAYGAKINFIDCNFVTQSAPPSSGSWYTTTHFAPVRVSGFDFATGQRTLTEWDNVALHFQNCTLNGSAIYGRDLCRKYNDSGHDAAGTLPLQIFKTSPITE